jgi:hypothetical protein
MNVTSRFFLLFLFSVVSLFSRGQQIAIGDWRDDLPYFDCISVAEAGSKIYCATPYSIFYYDKSDNSIQRFTKINGLSDIGITTLGYNTDFKTLVIAYTDANIDLIKNNTIINISDIKRATILGNKTINSIYFNGKYAYLSCGFGIVVLDVDKEEIHDTYYIGANGSQVNVMALTKDNHDTLFAATEKGIYLAYYNSPNLANFAAWKKDARMDTTKLYNAIVTFSNEVIVNKTRGGISGDTLFRYSNGAWTPWIRPVNNKVMNLQACYNNLVISYNYFVHGFAPDFSQSINIYSYFDGNPFPNDAIVDKDNTIWVADNYAGLFSMNLTTSEHSTINLGGPLTSQVFTMSIRGNDLYVAPGGHDNSFVPLYNPAAVYHFNSSSWDNLSGFSIPEMSAYHDIVCVAADPGDSKHLFAGSWGGGLFEFYDGKYVTRYTESNSTLHHHSAGDTSDIRIGGAVYDKDGALWLVNTHNDSCLSRKLGTQWTGYNILEANEADLGNMIIDTYGQKWILMRYTNQNPYSILVFTDNGTPENPTDDHARRLNSTTGNGAIPGNTVFAIACDLTGQVWIGTEQGIAVFYSPENIFTGSGFDAQRIKVQQGLYVQYLLENETVTAIAVDGHNQKWIGTDRGGIYLFSPDGTTQLQHFTEDNSPLFSNRITSIAINNEGEVFIGTDKGIISYKARATPGGETNSNVYAYPNPVSSDYSGWIAIKGLVTDAQVRITDVSGTLIYTTKAEGGQAIWDGKTPDGHKAKTGVYLVFASNDKATEKVVTKILIIN